MVGERRSNTATVDHTVLLMADPTTSQKIVYLAANIIIPEVEDVDPPVGTVVAAPIGLRPPTRAISFSIRR